MKVKSFITRICTETLIDHDERINEWLTEHGVEPRFVSQAIGDEQTHEPGRMAPVMVTQVWY